MREYRIREFKSGLVNKVEDFSIPEDAASRALNWLTRGDKIELSGGYAIIGTELGAGKVTGLGIGEKVDETLLPIRTRGQKVEFFDGSDWVESGSNALGAAADGEDVTIVFYTSLAGYQAWLSSPNSGLFKMMLAAPGSIKDQYDPAKNFKGSIAAANGRLLLWNRLNNKNYLYGSYKDVQNTVVYTTVTAEAVGASPGPTYTGSLTAITGKRTGFGVVFTDGTTTIQDDGNGGFIGAVGTINYATGAYSVTFPAPTVGAVTVTYRWEDSTSKGLADFTFSATRLATEGFFLPQATGGDLLSVESYRTDFYCIHRRNAWIFSLPVDDLNPTNLVFRENIGLAALRGAVATGDGIYFIDTSNPDQPRFKLLTLETTSDQVVPTEISFNIDLNGLDFTDGVAFRWSDYVLFACKTPGNAVNNRLFAYHLKYKSVDLLNYQVSCLADNDGALWAGESSTDNVAQLFTGFTANGSLVANYWEGKLTKLQTDELKKTKRLTVCGQIGVSQHVAVDLAYDGGGFSEVGVVDGDGPYVSTPSSGVGTTMVGAAAVGGDGAVTPGDYIREIRVRTPKFNEVKIRFRATGVGYASVSEINYHDVRLYGAKNLRRFRNTA